MLILMLSESWEEKPPTTPLFIQTKDHRRPVERLESHRGTCRTSRLAVSGLLCRRRPGFGLRRELAGRQLQETVVAQLPCVAPSFGAIWHVRAPLLMVYTELYSCTLSQIIAHL